MYMISALVTCGNRSFFQLCLPESILTPLNSNLIADFDEDDLYFASPQNKKKFILWFSNI